MFISYRLSSLKVGPTDQQHLSVSPRSLLEMPNLGPHPSPKSDLNPLGDYNKHYSLRSTILTIVRILDFILTVMENH